MTVHHQTNTQHAIQDRVVAPAGDECCGSERDQAGGKNALECPVVRPMRARGLWKGGGVVHRALENGCRNDRIGSAAFSFGIHQKIWVLTSTRNIGSGSARGVSRYQQTM